MCLRGSTMTMSSTWPLDEPPRLESVLYVAEGVEVCIIAHLHPLNLELSIPGSVPGFILFALERGRYTDTLAVHLGWSSLLKFWGLQK